MGIVVRRARAVDTSGVKCYARLSTVNHCIGARGDMYEAFYGLEEKPFNLTPDPRYLYLSEKHKEAFAHLLFGIKNRMGFIMVSGEIGTGKTTICRSLLNQLDPDTEIAFVFNPSLSPKELLRHINEDFGIDTRGETVRQLVGELNLYLLDRNARGKNCVLVIDEAQNLTPAVLEQIRLLSNLETETQKLLQIVLIGQPELAEHLHLPELRQLNQRITARYHLKPLDAEETGQYIEHRLHQAGGRGKVSFLRRAKREVFRVSKGTPRVINAVCDRALLVGYTREERNITPAIIKQAAKEIRGEAIKHERASAWTVAKRFLPSPPVVGTGAVAIVVLLVVKLLDLGPLQYAEIPANTVRPSMAASEQVGTPASPLAERGGPKAMQLDSEALATTVREMAALLTRLVSSEQGERPAAPVDPLDALDRAAARRVAMSAILRSWNMAMVGGYPENDLAEHLVTFAENNGLTCEMPVPSLESVLAIDLPVLTMIRAGEKEMWVAIVGIEDGQLRVTTDGAETVLTSREAFRQRFASQAIVMWRDPTPDAAELRRQMRGAAVEELQRDLTAIGRLWGEPTGVYDEDTERAITRIQVETGIKVDGIVGKQVRMVLSSWLAQIPTPSLSGRVGGPWPVVLPVIADAVPQEPAEATETMVMDGLVEDDAVPAVDRESSEMEQPPEQKIAEEALAEAETVPGDPVSGERPDEPVASEGLALWPFGDARASPGTAAVKEVTPPSTGNAPLVPREGAARDGPDQRKEEL